MYNPFLPEKAAAAHTGSLTLATVGAVSEEGVTLILPGATEPTQAHYPNFSSSSLASGDSVIISRVSGTWVVMGKAGGGGGGGGGTSDYNDLSNKPPINGNTLSGNKTAAQLGLGTYSKPSGGIPKFDLASAVQTSLGKADSALQSVPSTYRTAAAQDAIDASQDEQIAEIQSAIAPSQYVFVAWSSLGFWRSDSSGVIHLVFDAPLLEPGTTLSVEESTVSVNIFQPGSSAAATQILNTSVLGATCQVPGKIDVTIPADSSVTANRICYYSLRTGLTVNVGN